MRLSVTIFGRTVLDVALDTARDAPPEHIEDHTGYIVGFAPAPPVPTELEMPDRD